MGQQVWSSQSLHNTCPDMSQINYLLSNPSVNSYPDMPTTGTGWWWKEVKQNIQLSTIKKKKNILSYVNCFLIQIVYFYVYYLIHPSTFTQAYSKEDGEKRWSSTYNFLLLKKEECFEPCKLFFNTNCVFFIKKKPERKT